MVGGGVYRYLLRHSTKKLRFTVEMLTPKRSNGFKTDLCIKKLCALALTTGSVHAGSGVLAKQQFWQLQPACLEAFGVGIGFALGGAVAC